MSVSSFETGEGFFPRRQTPHPPSLREGTFSHKGRREEEPLSVVIARSEATKQSSFPRAALWIASRSLSSGAHSRDPLARNDE
ncbi:MAG: hypothetical protein K2X57_00145, partial [Xanthobacteraceae bacterium]|nr:hypothetical protein [Xanthobacteraceae bacterium]